MAEIAHSCNCFVKLLLHSIISVLPNGGNAHAVDFLHLGKLHSIISVLPNGGLRTPLRSAASRSAALDNISATEWRRIRTSGIVGTVQDALDNISATEWRFFKNLSHEGYVVRCTR